MIFNKINHFLRHIPKSIFGHIWDQSQLSPIYRGILCVLVYSLVVALLHSEGKPEDN